MEGRFWIEKNDLVLSLRTPLQGLSPDTYYIYLDRKVSGQNGKSTLAEIAFLEVKPGESLPRFDIAKHRINNPGGNKPGSPDECGNELKVVATLLLQATIALNNMRRQESEKLVMPPIDN
jgi:hypothetical protein